MQSLIVTLSISITVVATVPYLIQVVRGEVKPRLATWFIWALLAFIGASASFIAHQGPAAAFTLATAIECEWVVIAGWKHGDRSFEPVDILSLIGALLCLVLLIFLRSPTLAVVAVALVSLIGTIPTFSHAWNKPYEETWLTYALFIPAEGLILVVANIDQPTSYIFPLYFLLQDLALAAMVALSPHRRPQTDENTATQASADPSPPEYSRVEPGRIIHPSDGSGAAQDQNREPS
jgi:hypothetical protein